MKVESRARRFTEWTIVAILLLSFLGSGFPKIDPGSGMVRRFEAWGYGAGFATVIGIVELLGGLLILVPKARRLGAGLIVIDMVGAIYTHLRTVIGSPVLAGVYLALATGIVLLRRQTRTPLTTPHGYGATTTGTPASAERGRSARDTASSKR